MSKTGVAINGLGRIGRNFLRALLTDKKAQEKLELKAINIGPANRDSIAHLLKYDTLMGTYPGTIAVQGNNLIIDNHTIALVAELDPKALPWKALGIDWVVECTGRFTEADKAWQHITAGAKHVLISAPAKGEDATIIPGVNDELFDAQKHAIVSLGSCTTNALATVVKVINDTFGIEQAYMTTVHAYTNSQVLLDVNDSDVRRSRAAALNMIPTTTGANEMVNVIFPELAGKIKGHAIRVPIAKVSLLDFVFVARKPVTVQAIHEAFAAASKGKMRTILSLTMEPLVSSDFNGCPDSVVIDGLLTCADGNMGKVFGWYDNEWAYGMRLKDFLLKA